MVLKIIAAPHTPRQNIKKVAHLERPLKMMRATFDAGIFAAQQAVFGPCDEHAASSPASTGAGHTKFSNFQKCMTKMGRNASAA